jgi:hypothetical protein
MTEDGMSALVTFIIPSIGRQSLINTIISLRKQTRKEWKAIVLFDGFRPQLPAQWTDDPQFQFFFLNKQGTTDGVSHSSAGTVRNHGLSLCETEWAAFVDDDDTVGEDYVARLYEEIERSENKAECIVFRMAERMILPPAEHKDLVFAFVGISFALRRSIFADAGIQFQQSEIEDYTLLKRIQKSKHMMILSPYLTYFVRRIPQNPADLEWENKDEYRVLLQSS